MRVSQSRVPLYRCETPRLTVGRAGETSEVDEGGAGRRVRGPELSGCVRRPGVA